MKSLESFRKYSEAFIFVLFLQNHKKGCLTSNRMQNKRLFYNVFVCTVYDNCVYRNTLTYMYIFYKYLHVNIFYSYI